MIVDNFFKMEEECDLFNLQANEKTPIWDIFRMHIYLKYHFPETNNNIIEKKSISLLEIYLFSKKFINSFWYFLTKNGANFILPCSRYQDDKGYYYDKAAMSVIESLDKNSFIFELQSTKRKYRYKAANNYLFVLKKTFTPKQNLSQSQFLEINLALNKYFGECRVTYNELDLIYKNYLYELRIYKLIFLFKKSKRIFITQNGLQKGLIAAAKELNIKVYEFQHGSFERDNLGYSYPKSINAKSNIIFQDYVITFSNYWGSYFNVPAINLIALGNDAFYSHPTTISDESILIVSSVIHGNDLCKLVAEIAKVFPERIIKFKLHSNEYHNESIYKNILLNIPNIQFIKNEIDVVQLISSSSLVVLINSTVLYEALNQSKKVAIFKRVNYLGQKNVFNLPNVFIFDLASELKTIINTRTIKQEPNFFVPFKKNLFKKMLVDEI